MKLLVGTSKGLVVFEKNDTQWEISNLFFRSLPITVVFVDERNGNWWVAMAHRHWGQKLYYSTDHGENWESIRTPVYPDGAEIYPGKVAS